VSPESAGCQGPDQSGPPLGSPARVQGKRPSKGLLRHRNFRSSASEPDQGRSRHAKSRSPYSAIFKARDLPRGLDRVGVVCLAITVLGKEADSSAFLTSWRSRINSVN
jgi:hypothetical protein